MAEANSRIASTSKTPTPIMHLLNPSVVAAPKDLPLDEEATPRVDILPGRQKAKQQQQQQQLPKKKKSKSKSKKKAQKQTPAVVEAAAKPKLRLQAVRVPRPEMGVEQQTPRRRKPNPQLVTIMAASATSTEIAAVVETPARQSVNQERRSASAYEDEHRDSAPSVSEDNTPPDQPKVSVTKHLRAMFSSTRKSREKKEKKATRKAAKKAVAAVAASIAPPAHAVPVTNLAFPSMKHMAPPTATTPAAAPPTIVLSPRASQPGLLVDLDDAPPATFEAEEDLLHQGEIVAVDEEMTTQPSLTSYSHMSLNKLSAEKAAEQAEASRLQVEPPKMEILLPVVEAPMDTTKNSPRAPSATPTSRVRANAKTRAKTPAKSRSKAPAKMKRDVSEIPKSIGFPDTEVVALEESDENVVILTSKEKAALMVEDSVARMMSMPILPHNKSKSAKKKRASRSAQQQGDDDDNDEPNISQVIKKAALVSAIKKTKLDAKSRKKKETQNKKEHERMDTFPDDFDLGEEVIQLFSCCHEEMLHIMKVLPIYFKKATKDTPCDVTNMQGIPSEIPCDTEKAKAGCSGAVKMVLVAGMGVAAACGAGDINMSTSCMDDDNISVLTDPHFTALGPADRIRAANIDDDDDDVHVVIVRSMDEAQEKVVVSPAIKEDIIDQAFANDGIIPVEDKPENDESQIWDFLPISWSRSKASKADDSPAEGEISKDVANISETPAETPAPAPEPVQTGPTTEIPDFKRDSASPKGKKMTKKEKKSAKKSLRQAAAAAVEAVAASKKAKKKAAKAKLAAVNSLNGYTSDAVSNGEMSTPEEAAAAAVAALTASERAKADAQAKIDALNNLKKLTKEAEARDDSEDLVKSIPEESAGDDLTAIVPEVSLRESTESEKPAAEEETVPQEEQPLEPAPVDQSVHESKNPKKKTNALLLPDIAPLIANSEEKESTQDEIVQPRPTSRQRSRQMSRRRHEFEHRDEFFGREKEERTILSAASGALKSVRSGALKSVRSGALRSVRSGRSGTGTSARSPLRGVKAGTDASSTRSPLRSTRSGSGTKQSGTAQTGTDYSYRSAMSRRNEGQMAEMERLRAKRRHKKNSNTAPGNDEIEKARLHAALSSDSSLGVARGNAYPLLDGDSSDDEDELPMMAVRPDATDNEVDLSVSSSIVRSRTCLFQVHLNSQRHDFAPFITGHDSRCLAKSRSYPYIGPRNQGDRIEPSICLLFTHTRKP